MVKHTCHKCGKSFRHLSKLNEHLNRVTPCNEEKKVHQCHNCFKIFDFDCRLKAHQKICLNKIIRKPRCVSCSAYATHRNILSQKTSCTNHIIDIYFKEYDAIVCNGYFDLQTNKLISIGKTKRCLYCIGKPFMKARNYEAYFCLTHYDVDADMGFIEELYPLTTTPTRTMNNVVNLNSGNNVIGNTITGNTINKNISVVNNNNVTNSIIILDYDPDHAKKYAKEFVPIIKKYGIECIPKTIKYLYCDSGKPELKNIRFGDPPYVLKDNNWHKKDADDLVSELFNSHYQITKKVFTQACRELKGEMSTDDYEKVKSLYGLVYKPLNEFSDEDEYTIEFGIQEMKTIELINNVKKDLKEWVKTVE